MRRFQSKPDDPDTEAKTLLGPDQRRWLMDTLAASPAPFKIVLTGHAVPRRQRRDGNWGAGFTAERNLILEHVRSQPPARRSS